MPGLSSVHSLLLQVTKAKDDDLAGSKRGSTCFAVSLKRLHCVQVRSLAVSAMRVCSCGGVPMPIVTVYPSSLMRARGTDMSPVRRASSLATRALLARADRRHMSWTGSELPAYGW